MLVLGSNKIYAWNNLHRKYVDLSWEYKVKYYTHLTYRKSSVVNKIMILVWMDGNRLMDSSGILKILRCRDVYFVACKQVITYESVVDRPHSSAIRYNKPYRTINSAIKW